MAGVLYSVATPIGNLNDITLRALKILKQVDYILTERKATTLKLLNFFRIRNKLVTYREDTHSKLEQKILRDLLHGKKIALVSEAGTPGFSDPGAALFNAIYRLNLQIKQDLIKVVPIPGPNSVAAAFSTLPLASPKFIFMGFSPQRHYKFQKILTELLPVAQRLKLNIVFFENSRRLLEHLDICKNLRIKNVCIAKELTKVHESILCDSPEQLQVYFKKSKNNLLGEFILIIKYNKND